MRMGVGMSQGLGNGRESLWLEVTHLAMVRSAMC